MLTDEENIALILEQTDLSSLPCAFLDMQGNFTHCNKVSKFAGLSHALVRCVRFLLHFRNIHIVSFCAIFFFFSCQKFTELLGYDIEDIKKQSIISLTPPVDVPLMVSTMGQVLCTRKGMCHVDKHCLHAKGHAIELSVTMSIMSDTNGNTVRCIAFMVPKKVGVEMFCLFLLLILKCIICVLGLLLLIVIGIFCLCVSSAPDQWSANQWLGSAPVPCNE